MGGEELGELTYGLGIRLLSSEAQILRSEVASKGGDVDGEVAG